MPIAALVLLSAMSAAPDDETLALPPAFAPFEYLIGGWKGTGIPTKNRLKGWPEKHSWAWKFAKGKPVGMTLEITGGKVLAKADITPDAKTGGYRFEGTDPDGKPIKFAGKLDDAGMLKLERVDPPAEVGQERLDINVPASVEKIRYTMRLFRKEPDAPQYASIYEANVGKEGESFAAGGAAADLPKCIITGGAGTIMVSFMGKSYPVCCSGCRDEFNGDPEKYVKKYLAKVAKGDAPAAKAEAADPKAEPKGVTTTKAMPKADAAKPKSGPKPPAEKDKGDPASKAASLIAQAAALEKAGKKEVALSYYKRVAKEFPETASAKVANAKIKVLGGK